MRSEADAWPELLVATAKAAVTFLLVIAVVALAGKCFRPLFRGSGGKGSIGAITWFWMFAGTFYLGPLFVAAAPVIVAIRRKQSTAILFLISVVSVLAAAVSLFVALVLIQAIAGGTMSPL